MQHQPYVKIRLTPEMRRAVEDYARRNNIPTLSEIFRDAGLREIGRDDLSMPPAHRPPAKRRD